MGSRISTSPGRTVLLAVSLVAAVWACARPTHKQTADAQPSASRPTRAKQQPRQSSHPDPCRAALEDHAVTPVDARGRPKPVPGASPRLTLRVSTARSGPIGRSLDRAELWYLSQPDGGCFEVFVDGRLRGRVSTRSDAASVSGGPGGRPAAPRPPTSPSARIATTSPQVPPAWTPTRLRPMPPPRRRPSAPPGRRATPRPRRDAQGAAKRHAQPLRRILRWRIPPEPAGSSSAAAAKGAPRFFEIRRLRLEPGPHTLEVRPVGRGTVRLFGWVLTRSQPGVIVHNVGVTGAQASTALLGHEALITQQLQRLDPTLVVIHVGTNDAYDRRLTAARFAKRLKELIARLRPAPSPPDCVVVGAPDFGDRHWRKARRLQRRAALIRKVQRRVAIEAGCAYWDQYAAMGGRGAIRRFLRARPRWAYRDRVHLTARGYQALGRLLFQALKQAYAGYLAARPRLGVSPPRRSAKARRADREARRQWPSGVTPVRLYDPRGRALHRFFRSLVLLSKKVQQARARVLYVGDSHAAGDHLTGALRQRLQAAFGDAGHGYVHAGTPWKGYRRTGLRVGATGPWRYYYLRSRKAEPQPDDRLFGLGGISTWVTLPLPPPTDEDDGAGGSNADAGNADAESGAGDRPAATPRANVTPRANATPRADATSRPDATYGMDAGS